MIIYYLDASAWVKRYYQEVGTQWVQGLFIRGETIGCATLGMIEVIATLSRKHKAREITAFQFKQKAQELEDDWKRFIQIQMTSEVVDNAKELTKKLALRGSDAIHLSSALLLQRRFLGKDDRLIVVTSDYELKKAAKSTGLTDIDPIEQKG
ncbi:MAG: type II toxin-antitoxin system VapC family toxin [Proteobacteria bacterium]|nr:type II toxin-antitoxin system VapC family toxin [Pseudomonadota bacterium]